MTRPILEESRIHPAIREKISTNRTDIVTEVEAAIAAHPVVVVGMSQNPVVGKVRKLLQEKGQTFHYIEYGSYFSEWRRRNALKMWSGWPTFPMVFVKGVLVGGFEDVQKLYETNTFAATLS
jgi:glutaredoxin-related protein